MDEHKENIHAKNLSGKMANIKEEEKVGVSAKLASCYYFFFTTFDHIKRHINQYFYIGILNCTANGKLLTIFLFKAMWYMY